VRAVVGIARGLGQRTIAEGVEDDLTLRLLRDLGVDQAQGYALGRPEPV
jgi:EAL domain-containing protein (putative c-di-GMP-specific phosphodiesterase class I)